MRIPSIARDINRIHCLLEIQIALGSLCFYLLNLATLAKGKLKQLIFDRHYITLHQ